MFWPPISIIVDEAMFYKKLISLLFVGACIIVHGMIYEETAASPINGIKLMLAQLRRLKIQMSDGFIRLQDIVLVKTSKF